MQTILGSGGIIATKLAQELHKNFTQEIRLVSRNPKKVNKTDVLFSADLMNSAQTNSAVKGSDIAYMTVGLPYNSKSWTEMWPIVMRNVINACKLHKVKLVFFDNTYMYGQVKGVMTEDTSFNSIGAKGIVRGKIAQMLLDEIKQGNITAMICRAPEFYGPENTQGGTNTTIFENIKKRKKLQVLLRDDTLRTLIFTPDAGRATALLGNTPDAYNQTWHLPCDTNRLTVNQFIKKTSIIYGRELKYIVLKSWVVKLLGMFNSNVKEVVELLYQWEQNYLFDCSKFNERFPDFQVTLLEEGIQEIITEIKQNKNNYVKTLTSSHISNP